MSDPVPSYTNGEPFLITQEQQAAERLTRVHYLLPDGRRHAPLIDQAYDSPELRAKIGDALAQGRTGIGRGGKK